MTKKLTSFNTFTPFSASFFLRWYKQHKRDLPWRKTKDPYRIWVSEVMLQQTQVSRVIGFYEKFVNKFQTIGDLAEASWPHVLSVVRGIGYYRRFRNMLTTAKLIQKNFHGKFPADYAALRKFPGVGDYTANALLAFAFVKHVPVLDTNIRRLLWHFFEKKNDRHLKKILLQFCPPKKARDFFQTLMDYASLEFIKKKKLRGVKRKARGEQLRRSENSIRVAAGIVHRDGKILIQKRGKHQHLRHHWEFPGGKIELEENARTCLKRELKEELGIEVAVRPPFSTLTHRYRDRKVFLSFHRCSILLGEPKAREGQEFQWVHSSDFRKFRFAPADKPVVEFLMGVAADPMINVPKVGSCGSRLEELKEGGEPE